MINLQLINTIMNVECVLPLEMIIEVAVCNHVAYAMLSKVCHVVRDELAKVSPWELFTSVRRIDNMDFRVYMCYIRENNRVIKEYVNEGNREITINDVSKGQKMTLTWQRKISRYVVVREDASGKVISGVTRNECVALVESLGYEMCM
ncbi:Hypothetical protein FSTVST1_8 [Faustovirus ST1]|nr:Hypothetical protein FSTVST1_8 [Faustovirus ST1]